jgi:CheY-like chemotaxis protein
MDPIFILIAEDDADDRFLLQSAFEENGFRDSLRFVENGIDLMTVLHEIAAGGKDAKLPRFILLDLNMPKKDGREVLPELKGDQRYRQIPVIVFSTTNSEQEMRRCYELGANSYITKPNSFDNLVKIVAALRGYWMQVSSVPF